MTESQFQKILLDANHELDLTRCNLKIKNVCCTQNSLNNYKFIGEQKHNLQGIRSQLLCSKTIVSIF